MTSGDEREIGLDFCKITQHGYGFLANNASKLIALITAMVAVAVTFADVVFTGFSGAQFSSTLIVMVVASYLIHFSLEAAGERYGEGCDEYRKAAERYNAACARVGAGDLGALRTFLSDYTRRELADRRARILAEAGVSDEELSAMRSGGVLRKSQKSLLRNLERQRAIRINATELLSIGRGGGGELENPEPKKLIRLILGMIPTTLCTVFTVSVVLSLKDGLSASTVLDGLFKLSALPIIGFRGYLAGYEHATGDKARWVESKARLIEAFLAWQGAKVGESD